MADIHEGIITFSAIRNEGNGAPLQNFISVKFVRYPGSQQLVIWLPEPGYTGYSDFVLLFQDKIVNQGKVENILNGNVQTLWDTLGWQPGNYTLEFHHNEGWFHQLIFTKLEHSDETKNFTPYDSGIINELNIKEYLIRERQNAQRKNSAEHFDRSSISVSNDLSPEEAEIRNQANISILENFRQALFGKPDLPKLEYNEQGRSGTIIYLDDGIRLPFYYEMGGSSVHLIIDIPPTAKWESLTKIPIRKRREILLFIASTIRKEKAPSWRFEINDDSIMFYDS